MITSFKTEQLGIGFDFDIELEKDKQIYCFIGKNGIGKTQLLENMAKSLIYRHSIFETKVSHLKYSCLFSKFANNINPFDFQYIFEMPQGLSINNISIKNSKIESEKWNAVGVRSLPSVDRSNNDLYCDTPIIFVGAKNRGFTKNIDNNNIKILSKKEIRFLDSFERTLSYIDGKGLENQEIADWFASRLVINPIFITTSQNKIHEAITVLKLIERLEPSIKLISQDENGNEKPNITFHEGQLLISGIPLDKLSTGYVSIIKIFQEIVAGYSGWTDEQKLNEVDGIVFIDELEPHLHISWQTKIIGILRDFFPKTTFYISTHSPLVLAGLKSGEGYELIREGDTVKAKTIDNIENYFLNDIVKEFFGVDLNQERIAHVDKEKQKKAKSLLLNLAKSIQENE